MTDAWARISGDALVIDAARETLAALTERLVRQSDEAWHCVCCGCDLVMGATFSDRHGDDGDCELRIAVEILPRLRP